MIEIPRHGDIVAVTENVLQTVFVYINENRLKHLSATLRYFPPQQCTALGKYSLLLLRNYTSTCMLDILNTHSHFGSFYSCCWKI